MIKKQSYTIFTSGCLLFLLLCFHARILNVIAQEVEDEREFDYVEGSGMGPAHWGELKEEWAACKHGDMQSPIDLSNRRVKMMPKLGKLKRKYKPCNATVRNRGHDIAVQWVGDAGSIEINETNYKLQQSHWHSPSEHTVNGRKYALELHMVHQSSDPNVKSNIAVVGLFYKIGRPDPFLSKLMKDVFSMSDKVENKKVGVINPKEIKMGGKMYYRYIGSLTVPPCTEGVIWTMNKMVRTVSRDQVKLLRLAVHDYAEKNARPVQELNLRDVHFYGSLSRTVVLHT